MMETLHSLVEQYGLLAVFAGSMAEGESAAILGGFFAHQGIFVPWQAFTVAAIGAFIGDTLFFLLGRTFSEHPYVVRLRGKPGFGHAYRLVQAHPYIFVLSNRFIYGLRLVGGIAAGFSTISIPMFVLLNALSSLVWAAIFCSIGYVFGLGAEHLIGDAFMRHQRLFIGLGLALGVGVLAWLAARHFAMKDKRAAEQESNPPE